MAVTGAVEGEAKVTLKLALPTTPSTYRQNTGDQVAMENSMVCNMLYVHSGCV